MSDERLSALVVNPARGERGAPPPGVVMRRFAPERYQGRWYEVARIPTKYEGDCTGAIADYYWDAARRELRVVNICLFGKQRKRARRGVARALGDGPQGRFSLQFEDAPGARVGEYWVLDTDYVGFALVGSKGPYGEFLWLLSRDEYVQQSDIDIWFEKARERQFSTERLEVWPYRVLGASALDDYTVRDEGAAGDDLSCFGLCYAPADSGPQCLLL